MINDIRLHPEALDFLATVDEKAKKRIVSGLKKLKENPTNKRSGVDIKKLRGKKDKPYFYRLRIGDYRVIYSVDGDTVWVTEMFLRGRGYR